MASSGQLGQSRPPADSDQEDSARISGARPAQGHYEPLPLGSEAFLCPLPPAADADEQRGRGLLAWVIFGTCALAAAGSFAVVVAMRPPAAATVEQPRAPSADAQHRAASDPAQPSATEGQAAATRDARSIEASVETPPSTALAPEDVAETEPPAAAPAETAPSAHTAPRVHGVHRSASLAAQPDRTQVVAALASVQPAVLACFGATRGVATASITVMGSTGRVTTARISGQSGAIGSCIAREVRRARFPRFADSSLVISYPFAR
ncbi:MAG: hypothetical protein ACHQ53_15960 [Polyangiales bacterium]